MLTPSEHQKLKKYINKIDVQHLTIAFDALSEPNRCLLFRALLKSPQISVSQLATAVDISVSLASQHLKVLLQAGLVNKYKVGKRVYYQVNQGDALVVALGRAVEP